MAKVTESPKPLPGARPFGGYAQAQFFPSLPPQTHAPASGIARAGAFTLGLYLISGYATDIMLLTLGIKPYLSLLSGLAVLLMFLTSGRVTVALQTLAGKLWLFLLFWLLIDIPFSYWPGGSFGIFISYIPKQHVVFFFACSLAVTIEDCATLITANVIGCFALLFECLKFGTADADGRFVVPNSIVYSNPNDLGLQLVICVAFFAYLILSQGVKARLAGIGGLIVSFFYMVKTGSRGSLVACGTMFLFCLVFTRFRLKALLLTIPVGIALMFAPGSAIHRLTLIFLNPTESAAMTRLDVGSIGSQIERQELLKASVGYMVTHPIFGIGAGQFADYHWAQLKQVGQHVASLGTHNSYTEIGAECGLPALICFAGVILLSIRSNFRIYRQSARFPELEKIHNLSFCLVLGTLGYAVNAFFHHGAYSTYVPILGGLSAALHLAAKPLLQQRAAAPFPVQRF